MAADTVGQGQFGVELGRVVGSQGDGGHSCFAALGVD